MAEVAVGPVHINAKRCKIMDSIMLKGEDPISRTLETTKDLDRKLFNGATQLSLSARNCIPRMIYGCYLKNAEDAFSKVCSLFFATYSVCLEERVDEWAVFSTGSRTQKALWIAQYKEEFRRFYLLLKVSVFHPSHHFTESALVDMWTGVRTSVNELPLHVFGTEYAENEEDKRGALLGILSA